MVATVIFRYTFEYHILFFGITMKSKILNLCVSTRKSKHKLHPAHLFTFVTSHPNTYSPVQPQRLSGQNVILAPMF